MFTKDNVKVMSAKEFNEIDDIDNVKLKDDVINVYMSKEEDSGVVGCGYSDGSYSVVGCGMDRFVSYDELVSWLK